jgi:hypothetical protein
LAYERDFAEPGFSVPHSLIQEVPSQPSVGPPVPSKTNIPSGTLISNIHYCLILLWVSRALLFPLLGSAGDFPDSPTPFRDATPPHDSYASQAPSPVGDDYPSVLHVPPTPSLEDDDLPPTPLPSATPHSGDDTILLSPEAAVLPPIRSDDFDLFEDLPALGSMVLVSYSGPLILGKLFVPSIHPDLYAS